MRPAVKRDVPVLMAYVAISFAYFGWRLLPHPGRAIVGSGPDPLIFVWAFAWWPHAILGWTNPFVSHALFAPAGVNLAWATSVPGLAIPFAPLTLLAGPVASYNTAAVLLPALAAWAAYRLCSALTGSLWASLVGGYLYGFSSYVLAHQLQGHLNLNGEFVVPLLALALLRRLRGELDDRRFALRFGPLLALQLAISTEIALTLTLALVAVLALAWLLVSSSRPQLRALARPIAAGYAVAACAAAPLIAYILLGFKSQAFTGAQDSGTDLVNLVVPTASTGSPAVRSRRSARPSAPRSPACTSGYRCS